MKIKSLALTDFRAFPGPAPQVFTLDGKNLLVYGENGSGKSSVFLALKEIFSLKPLKPLPEHKNVFSGEAAADCKVTVEFMDGSPAVEWNSLYHPAATSGTGRDQRVVQGALRRACLDYRSLLDTNYMHGDNEINLFDIAVKYLVHDFPVTISGGSPQTIGELWKAVEGAKPRFNNAQSLARVNAACSAFNSGFNQALSALQPLIQDLLADLVAADVSVSPFRFPGVTYSAAHFRRDRVFNGRELKLEVTFRTHCPDKPQHFLNEARLSALALAIYLGGRLAFTPSPDHALKLLVLDDVLIGLDHSKRFPVLKVLKKRFSDWQIVLLTHDLVWFEMARLYTQGGQNWVYSEVYEADDIMRGIPSPIVRRANDKAAQGCLDLAKRFLAEHYIPAAANYTRAAFELALKSFCEHFSVPVPFKADPRHLDTNELLSSVESWFKKHSSKTFLAGIIEGVKLFRKVVLNPYSHSSPPNIASGEVHGAIDAVERLIKTLDPKQNINSNALEVARSLINQPSPPPEVILAAMGFLRASLTFGLKSYCERKNIVIPYSSKPSSTKTLWEKAKMDSVHPLPNDLAARIELIRAVIIEEPTETVLSGITHSTVSAALAAVEENSASNKTVLDVL